MLKQEMFLLLLFLILSSISVHPQEITPLQEEIVEEEFSTISCSSNTIDRVNTSCHYTEIENDIESFNFDLNSNQFKDSIFFIDTYCNGGLTFRQACAIESAAIANLNRSIHVLFAGPVHFHCLHMSPIWDILNYKNVHIARIHTPSFVQGTPLENLLGSGAFQSKLFSAEYIANVLGLVALYKYGGICLSTDVIVAKSFYTLKEPSNWVGREDLHVLGPAFLALANHGIGKKISTKLIRLLASDLEYYSQMGSGIINLLSDVLQRICKRTFRDTTTSSNCKGFEVYPPKLFYPIKHSEWKKYFEEYTGHIQDEPFGYHVWEKLSENEIIYEDSLYSQLMQRYCPTIYGLMH